MPVAEELAVRVERLALLLGFLVSLDAPAAAAAAVATLLHSAVVVGVGGVGVAAAAKHGTPEGKAILPQLPGPYILHQSISAQPQHFVWSLYVP